MSTFLDQRLPSPLHWTAVVEQEGTLHRVLFGYQSQRSLRQRLVSNQETRREVCERKRGMLVQLRDYARGDRDSFEGVTLDWEEWTPFQRAILQRCYRVPYGSTLSYAELAASAGYPRAARAAGSVMARNRLPIIIPCHRIVPSAAGRWGHFSSPGGTATKRALLELERTSVLSPV